MQVIVVSAAAVILFLISAIHVYWAFGGQWGGKAAVPQKESGRPAFVPGPAPTFAVAFIVLAVGLLLLIQSGQLSLLESNGFTRVCCILCTVVFFLRAVGDFKYFGFFKTVKHSVFSRNDTWLYSPLCLYLAISFATAVWGLA